MGRVTRELGGRGNPIQAKEEKNGAIAGVQTHQGPGVWGMGRRGPKDQTEGLGLYPGTGYIARHVLQEGEQGCGGGRSQGSFREEGAYSSAAEGEWNMERGGRKTQRWGGEVNPWHSFLPNSHSCSFKSYCPKHHVPFTMLCALRCQDTALLTCDAEMHVSQ